MIAGFAALEANVTAPPQELSHLEFFGKRHTACRRLAHPDASPPLCHGIKKRRLNSLSVRSADSVAARKRQHLASVHAVVRARAGGATAGPLGPVPALDAPEEVPRPWREIVAAVQAPGSAQPQPPEADQEGAATVLGRQAAVVAKKRAAHVEAKACAPIPYIGARGETFRFEECGKPPVKNPKRMQLGPRPVLFLANGITLPAGREEEFLTTTRVQGMDAVVVQDVTAHFYSKSAFIARTMGVFLADKTWLYSGMRMGACLHFPGIKNRHMVLHLSPAFCAEWKDHCTILKKTAAASPGQSAGGKCLTVHCGSFRPETPQHPRLTFGCVGAEEPEGDHVLRMDGLLHLLGQGVERCL